MKTPLTSLLGCTKPILSAPMAGAAGPDLVAAVCNAGGYGVTPLWSVPAQAVPDGIAAVRALTDRPFAVNIKFGPDHRDHLQACIDAQVHGVSLFWGHDLKTIETAKAGGLKVLVSVGSAVEARQAAEAGADIIVAQGWEAGGHVWGQVATMALIPAVADAVDVPVIAAGGIADGRGMAAAMVLGASGVWVGTRFLASAEATIHADYRARILAASDSDTEWYANLYDGGWPDAPHRSLANATSQAWRAAGAPAPGARPGEGVPVGQRPNGDDVMRYQSYTPLLGTTGDVAAMSMWSGQGVGLVDTVMPASQIVDDIYTQACDVLRSAGSIAPPSG